MSRVTIRTAGLVGIVAGLLGALSGIWLVAVTPAVGFERFSYPLDAPGFIALQLAFFVQHLGLILVVMGLGAAGVVRTRTGRAAFVFTIISLAALAITELIACFAAESVAGSVEVDILNTTYGVVALAIGVGATVLGASIARSSGWQGWRRWTPLAVGVYAFVPLMPLMFLGYEGARFGIAGWMLTFALLGVALVTAPKPSSDAPPMSANRKHASGADTRIGTRS